MADNEEHPLLKALPPATDYLTYLTLIEYNLNEESLPVLHQVLQDTTLTTNIGWDLVHLLLPLLPASEQCLQDIATRGNPREVILKVTEALRLLDFEELEQESEQEDNEATGSSSAAKTTSGKGESSNGATNSSQPPAPPAVLQFNELLSMLPILHRRVKTKYPSRFLSTSLQAALAAYSKARSDMDELTFAVVQFIKELSGTKRPKLPSRVSSGNLLRQTRGNAQPDPEAQTDSPSAEETELSNRLLQSLVTHVIEDYFLSLSSDDDVPGLAWSSRLMESFQPERIIPHKTTYADRFAQDENLQARSSVLGQLVAISQDLNLSSEDLLQAITAPEPEKSGIPGEESDPPASAEEIPLSKTGSLFLFAARKVSERLFKNLTLEHNFSIFPDHATILSNFVGVLGPSSIGMEPEALLDAILCPGLVALEDNEIGEPEDDEHFTKYLQTTSLISANTPSPSLRYLAHYLTSTILRSHPSDIVRLSFIRDTLEHCPYENLKASAVGWMKGETLEANLGPSAAKHASSDEPPSIFATPVALSTVSPYLFPDLTQEPTSAEGLQETWMKFKLDLGFYLATLNFYYLLLSSKQLREAVDIPGLHETNDIGGSYLHPLRELSGRFKEGLADGGELREAEDDENVAASLGDLTVLDDVLQRVTDGVTKLNGL